MRLFRCSLAIAALAAAAPVSASLASPTLHHKQHIDNDSATFSETLNHGDTASEETDASTSTTTGASQKPNIVLIVADDLGYNGLGYMNASRGILTPNIDALADSGVSLLNYYVQPICSPTRSALMSGRYPIHIGTQSNVIFWDTPWGVPLEFDFIPKLLKEHAGYDTAMYGKWHLGMFKEDYTPWQRGFDEFLGYLQGCGSAYTHVSACCRAGSPDHDEDYVCPAPTDNKTEDFRAYDWFNGTAPPSAASNADPHVSGKKTDNYFPDFTANHTNSAHLVRDAAVQFLEAREARQDPDPFFLYLPFQNIHGPYTCDQKYYDLYNSSEKNLTVEEQTMFGYITEMDDMIGNIMSTLNSTALYANTWVIFTSDNGAPPSANVLGRNFPLRGHKASIWEGGVRVPGFVHSPLLPANRRGVQSHEMYHVTDWLPTILDMAGVEKPPPQKIDGVSILESLVTGSASPRKEILVNMNPLCTDATDSQANAPRAGIRVGDLKLLVPCFRVSGINGSNATGSVVAPFKVTVPQGGDSGAPFLGPDTWPMLFNLTADIGETTNLAAKMPHAVETMLQRLTEHASSMVEPMQWFAPFQGAEYFCADCPKADNLGGPTKPAVPWLD